MYFYSNSTGEVIEKLDYSMVSAFDSSYQIPNNETAYYIGYSAAISNVKRDDSKWLEELNIKTIGATTPVLSAAKHFGGVICNIQIVDFEFFGYTESANHESFDVELGF